MCNFFFQQAKLMYLLKDISHNVSKRSLFRTDLLCRDRDLVSFLLGLLTDEPHHLLNLLWHICVLHAYYLRTLTLFQGFSDDPLSETLKNGTEKNWNKTCSNAYDKFHVKMIKEHHIYIHTVLSGAKFLPNFPSLDVSSLNKS